MTRSKPDDGLRALIVKHLPVYRGSTCLWVPIETAATASGVPDLWGIWRGCPAWVECKATAGWVLGTLSEFQVGFQVRLARAGGRGFVLTRRRHGGGPRRGAAVDELWVHDGAAAPALRMSGLRVPPLLLDWGGPAAWDWAGVGGVLFGGA